MLMSHLLDINRIVFCMGAYKADVDNSVRIVDLHNQPVVVALDVEHNAVVAEDARLPILRFDLGRAIPVLSLDLPVPSQKGLLGIGMGLPECPERLLGDNSHMGI